MNRSLPPEIAAIEAQIRVWHPDVKPCAWRWRIPLA
jgi:hypothetical protein